MTTTDPRIIAAETIRGSTNADMADALDIVDTLILQGWTPPSIPPKIGSEPVSCDAAAAARAEFTRAVQPLLRTYLHTVHIHEYEPRATDIISDLSQDEVLLGGWVLTAEYETPNMMQTGWSHVCSVGPEEQSRATTVGIATLAAHQLTQG